MKGWKVRESREVMMAFREECWGKIEDTYRGLREELTKSETAIISQAESRFSSVESLLSGPYDKRLLWEWVSESSPCRAISQAMLQRRIRLKELPEFEICAKEFFEKFARSTEEVVRELTAIGFYLPPNSKLFEHFLADVIEGKKLIIALNDLRKTNIPEEQIELAFSTVQKMINTDADLQKFLPHGLPESLQDKSYFLDIVNSLRGLNYRVILPLSQKEQIAARDLRNAVVSLYGEMEKMERVGRYEGGNPEVREEELENFLEVYMDSVERLKEMLRETDEPMTLEDPI